MQRTCKLFLWILLIMPATPAFAQSPATASKAEPSAREVAQRTLPSVVLLMIETDKISRIKDRFKLGSGFFVSSDVVATNYHVIANGIDGLMKIVGQETEYQILGVVGLDKANDLALLKIKGGNGKPLPIGNSDSIAIGDNIFAVGNPSGLEGTFSQGIISSIRRDGQKQLIQITAPISPGSSGGPILNSRGEVIGVAFGGVVEGQALNFAIPSSFLKALTAKPTPLKQLAAVERSNSEEDGAVVEETPPAQVNPASSRAKAPRLSSDDVAVSRALSHMPGRGAVTEMSLITVDSRGRNKEVVYKSDECSFELSPAFAFSLDRNRDGIVDDMRIDIKCLNGSHSIGFSTTNTGLNIAPGYYDKVFIGTPPAGYPGFHIYSRNWDCSSPTNTTFQIHDAQFELGKSYSRIISFGATFEQTCAGSRYKGNLYINALK